MQVREPAPVPARINKVVLLTQPPAVRMPTHAPRTPLRRGPYDENTEAEGMRGRQLPAWTGHVE